MNCHHGALHVEGRCTGPRVATLQPLRTRTPRRLAGSLLFQQQGDNCGTIAATAGRGRHPELVQLRTAGPLEGAPASAGRNPDADRVDVTADVRYRRADYSDVFQYETRKAFARCIAGGEPSMALAEAALQVSAEDDAIASHSTVAFPVSHWLGRIDRLVDELVVRHRDELQTPVRQNATGPSSSGSGGGGDLDGARGPGAVAPGAVAAEGEELREAAGRVLAVVHRFLFEGPGRFTMPDYGRSNVPPNSLVDHAGVWEDARLGYLHETLVRRTGHPATLGLLLGEVCRRLLARGVLPCAAAVDTRDYRLLPRAVPLPELPVSLLLGTRGTGAGAGGQAGAGVVVAGGEAGAGSDGGSAGRGGPAGSGPHASSSTSAVVLNTCTSEVLVEMLRHLKRSYWPFPWDSGADAQYPGAVGSHGGFRSAAKAASGEEMSAVLAAVSQVAAWRLERGIWTSPGAGDIRRARAASERLVLLAGEACPEERRDLAVLLVHCGELGAARLEMRTYLQQVAGAGAGTGTGGAGAAAGEHQSSGPDPFDLVLCRRVLTALEGLGPGVQEPPEPLSVGAVLRMAPPWEGLAREERHLPLTW